MSEETITELPVIVGLGTANTSDEYLIQRQAPENLGRYTVADLVSRIVSTASGERERLVAENMNLVLKARSGFLGNRPAYNIEINGQPARPSQTIDRYLDNLPEASKRSGEESVTYRQLNIRVAPTSRGGYQI